MSDFCVRACPLWIIVMFIGLKSYMFIQGYNARKVILEVYASFDCSVLSLGGNVNTRQISEPDMGSRENWFPYVRRV